MKMFAIGIVAHTTRRTEAENLAATTQADYVSVDDGTLGCDHNHDTVQNHLAELPTTWSVILEDDAQPVPGFRQQLEKALPMSPSPIVSLYLGKQRPPHWQNRIHTATTQATTTGANWIIGTHLLHAVGYAIKTHLLPAIHNHPTELSTSLHIGHYARTHGHTIAYTWPSLINHKDLPTLIQHKDGQPRPQGRTAWATGTRNQWDTTAAILR